MTTRVINTHTGADLVYDNARIAAFLHEHLQEYGDPVGAITKAIEYSQQKNLGRGGFTLLALDEDTEDIIGAVVINETNMGGYIPENILVYIAVHQERRGEGLGGRLMTEAIDLCQGDIALHVEKDNPAKFLYEKLGFTNPYLEMRLKRS